MLVILNNGSPVGVSCILCVAGGGVGNPIGDGTPKPVGTDKHARSLAPGSHLLGGNIGFWQDKAQVITETLYDVTCLVEATNCGGPTPANPGSRGLRARFCPAPRRDATAPGPPRPRSPRPCPARAPSRTTMRVSGPQRPARSAGRLPWSAKNNPHTMSRQANTEQGNSLKEHPGLPVRRSLAHA